MTTARTSPALVLVALCGMSALAQGPLHVTIDVKPGDTPTTLEPNRQGMVPVAILSSAQFDATSIDTTTIRLGPTGTEAGVERSNRDDVNRDKRIDLMLLIRVQELKLKCGDTAIRLKAKTTDGRDVEGSEALTLEGC
ncbi:MAG: hypothetical protein ACT4QD_18710 [Acidobacteriota bacterium]